jgi:hypothetical protein
LTLSGSIVALNVEHSSLFVKCIINNSPASNVSNIPSFCRVKARCRAYSASRKAKLPSASIPLREILQAALLMFEAVAHQASLQIPQNRQMKNNEVAYISNMMLRLIAIPRS